MNINNNKSTKSNEIFKKISMKSVILNKNQKPNLPKF